MSITRKEAERKERKKLILAAALRVYKAQGLERATMDEIAQEADFGKATLYYYFKSKEDIFNTILITGWTTLWDSIEDIVIEDDSPRKQFIKMIKKIIGIVNEDRLLYEFLFVAPRSQNNPEQPEPEWKQYQMKLTNTLHQLIQSGIELNEFPQIDSQMTLQALGHIFHGLVFTGKDRENVTEEEIEKIFKQFIKKKK